MNFAKISGGFSVGFALFLKDGWIPELGFRHRKKLRDSKFGNFSSTFKPAYSHREK